MRISRSAWKARPAKGGPGNLDPNRVQGIALHWPGDAVKRTTVEQVCAALRGFQTTHIDTNGWSDIAYQEAVDQAGNSYRLRGLRTQSGANGDADVNARYGAILLMLAIGEKPSKAMITTLNRRIDRHREIFPRSRDVVGHSAIRPEPTACPGDLVRGLIASGEIGGRK